MAGLASRLQEKGHDVVLVTLDSGAEDRHHVCESVRRVPLDLLRTSRSIAERILNSHRRVAMIRDSLLNQNPDVVLSFCDRTNIDVLSGLKNASLPVVIAERSDPTKQDLGRIWEFRRRRSYPHAKRIIALTQSAAKHLGEISGREVDVIASAVDVPPIYSDRPTASERRQVIAVGRLEHEKGFDRLLDAFATVSRDHSQWTLRLVGEGSLRKQLQSQADALGIDDRVTMPGWVRPIWSELAGATIFALPSRYEGFPSALLEAMAVGVPSVAVDCESGPRAIIKHESNALLVADHRGKLAEGIQRLIEDADLRESLGRSGRDVVHDFSWDAMVGAYEKVLVEAAGC
jgi:glycosyltransferase involved in cell wall biosynthesis